MEKVATLAGAHRSLMVFRTIMPPQPRHVPVSTLARFAAEIDGFRPPQRTNTSATEHGIRWHERLAGAPRSTRLWPWVVFGAAAVAAALVFIA